MSVTRLWKVFGSPGHRQRESFFPSKVWNFSSGDDIRIIEVENSDKTGTNEYTIVRITRNTSEECFRELEGQVSDGLFENSRTGRIEEVIAQAERFKRGLAQIAQMQRAEEGNPFPCPRCGHKMRSNLVENALSRYEQVYICPDCGKDEFARGLQNAVLPLQEWAFTGIFKLTANDLTARDFEFINDREHGSELECTFECWFDVDLYFGTHVRKYEGDAFINLYAAHNPTTGTLRMYGTAVYPHEEESFIYEPTAEECTEILKAMEKGCKSQNNLTMAEMYEQGAE